MFHKKLAAAALCAVVALAGCGSAAKSESTASSAAESTESTAESTESNAESTEGTADSTESEAVSTVDDAEVVDEEPSEDTIADFIELSEYKGLGIVSEEAAEGDTANIDFVGYRDGEAFDGGSGKNYNLVLGSGSFIDGFEDQLIGAKAGDQVTVKVTFPENYSATELAGQDATFEVTVNSVYKKTPEDAFQELMKNSTVLQYPSSYIDMWVQVEKDMYASYASYYSMEVDAFMETYGITEENLQEYAKEATKSQLTAEAVLAAEGITSDSDEFAEAEKVVLVSSDYESKEAVLEDGVSEAQYVYAVKTQAAYDQLTKYSA